MLNQNQQEKHPSNEIKATEIPPFSGVIDSNFVQRIAYNYIKPPRAFLFSHYILSKIQRQLAAGKSAWRLSNFAPIAIGRQTSSENIPVPEQTSEVPSSAPPSQSLLFRTPAKNTLRRFDLPTAETTDSPAEKGDQSYSRVLSAKNNARLRLSAKSNRRLRLTVKPLKEIISKDFLQKQEEKFSQSEIEKPLTPSLQGLTTSLSFASLEGKFKPSDETRAEASSIEVSEQPTSSFEQSAIFRKPVSAVSSITDASFADTIAEKAKGLPQGQTPASILSRDLSSTGRDSKLASLREIAPPVLDDELVHVQRQVEQPDDSMGTEGRGPQLEARDRFIAPSEASPIEVSEQPTSSFESSAIFRKPVSFIPFITDASFADTIAKKAKGLPQGQTPISILSRDLSPTVGDLRLVSLREIASPILGDELVHFQRQVEQPDDSVGTKGRGPQLEARNRFLTPSEAAPIKVSEAPVSSFESSAIFRKPVRFAHARLRLSVSAVPVNITDASFADTVAGKAKGLSQRQTPTSILSRGLSSTGRDLKLATLREVAPSVLGDELVHVHRTLEKPDDSAGKLRTDVQLGTKDTLHTPMTQDFRSVSADARLNKNRQTTIGFSGHSHLVLPSRQDDILAIQKESTEGAIAATYRQPAGRKTREAADNVVANTMDLPRWARTDYQDNPRVTTDNVGVMRKSIRPFSPPVLAGQTGAVISKTPVRSARSNARLRLSVRMREDFGTTTRGATKEELSTPTNVALLGRVGAGSKTDSTSNIGETRTPQDRGEDYAALANERTILSFLAKPIGERLGATPLLSSPSNAPMITRKHVLDSSSPFEGKLSEGIGNSADEPVELTHIQMASQTQYAMPQNISTPSMSGERRDIETVATAETPTPPPTPESTSPSMDMNRIAEKVYDIIERRLRSEKERRGYF